MTIYYIFILLNIFLILNALLLLLLLLQNIFRNSWRIYNELRSRPYINKINELITQGELITIQDFKIFLPYDRVILSGVLINLLQHFSGAIRAEITACLEQMGIVKKYIKQLRSISIKKKYNAIEKLGGINSSLAVKQIASLLDDPNEEIRLAAVRTLAYHQNKEYLLQILKVLPKRTDLTILAMLLSFNNALDELLLKIFSHQTNIAISNNIIILAGERRNLKFVTPLKKLIKKANPHRKTLIQNALQLCLLVKGQP